MALTTWINTDISDLPLNSSGIEWIEFSEGNDFLIFTQGSDQVKDGENIPTQSELINSGIELTGNQIVLTDYLLQDTSENLLKSIDNMGNLDKRFVLAFDFSAPGTASEPQLLVFDDTNLNTINNTMLGSGTPSASFIRGVTTTNASPGANWITTGTRMAGSSDGNFLNLNNLGGFLTGATTLYCNLAVVVPASQTTGFSANPVFVVKWLEN
ncbi:MAG: hypothetical protein IIC74_07965 [Bacteroidetes bacterium]|nr:hypothetical protein [Bacteroidota bacterium]